jgi:hypothetical protein
LRFEILRTDSLRIAMGGTTGNPISFPQPAAARRRGRTRTTRWWPAYAAIHHQTVNIADAYTEAEFDFSGTRASTNAPVTARKSFLTVPMKNHEGEVIGVLQLINARRPGTTEVVRVFQPTRAWSSRWPRRRRSR